MTGVHIRLGFTRFARTPSMCIRMFQSYCLPPRVYFFNPLLVIRLVRRIFYLSCRYLFDGNFRLVIQVFNKQYRQIKRSVHGLSSGPRAKAKTSCCKFQIVRVIQAGMPANLDYAFRNLYWTVSIVLLRMVQAGLLPIAAGKGTPAYRYRVPAIRQCQ